MDAAFTQTSGDMREYAKKYVQATMAAIDVIGSAGINHSASKKPGTSDALSDIFKCLGVKK